MTIHHQAVRDVEQALNAGELMLVLDYINPEVKVQSDDGQIRVETPADHDPWVFKLQRRTAGAPAIHLTPTGLPHAASSSD